MSLSKRARGQSGKVVEGRCAVFRRAATRAALVFAALLLQQAGAHAQSALVMNPGGRVSQNLAGKWQTIIDPYETGYYDYRYQPSSNGYFKNAKPRDKSDLIEYDFDKSAQLNVPGDWNTQDARLLFYEGTVWYKKSFVHAKKPGTRLFVHFGAANYAADVYLNGEKVGRHEGGFTPFDFEVTKLVKDGENFLIVKVDNRRRREGVPTVNTDWWNYGGLTREVSLLELRETFVRDYFVHLRKGSTREVTGWVQLDGPRLRQRVSINIPEAGVEKVVETDANGYAEFSLNANLKLWSPEDPKLYDVTIAAETDAVTERMGFRTIETRGADILLNGRPVFLRGVSIHEEAPLRGGRAYGVEDARTLLGWAKEMGCNFVRLAHYPHNEQMVREADRMGLMVWSEVPVYWTILWENPETLENARRQLTEMITRDRNRASVVLWSVSNETPLGDARLRFLTTLVKQTRSLDPTRLVTAALERHYEGERTQVIDDPLGEHLDVIGCNEYLGWYDGLPAKADGMEWRTVYKKPLIMSEFGGDALQGHHGDELTRWTEEYQESLYQHQIAMLKRIPFLRGTSPWILTDFRSPRRPLPGIQDFYNRKGLISDRGQKKKAFYVMRQYYLDLVNGSRP